MKLQIGKIMTLGVAAIAFSAHSYAATATNLDKLFEFGSRYNPEKVWRKPRIETSHWDNQNVPGERVISKVLKSGDSWAQYRECASCAPRKKLGMLYLSSETIKNAAGLQRGMERDEVISILGEPYETSEIGVMSYYPSPEDMTKKIEINLSGGSLHGISWNFGFD